MLTETTRHNDEIVELLVNLGIKHDVTERGIITIDRTSMVQRFPKDGDEHASYTCVFNLIKDLCGSASYVSWGVRTDDWLSLDVYQKY